MSDALPVILRGAYQSRQFVNEETLAAKIEAQLTVGWCTRETTAQYASYAVFHRAISLAESAWNLWTDVLPAWVY